MSAALSLDRLFDDDAQPEVRPIIVDRSTLERYQTCPAQGSAIERRLCIASSPEADAGQQVHDVVAEATRMAAEADMGSADVRQFMDDAIHRCRPDVQPEAVEGLRRSIYALTQHLFYHPNGEARHWDDLVRYDGGEGEQSGQLAWDLTEHQGRPVRLTCETDLLMACGSDEEFNLYDYKSGRKFWSATDVQTSFQLGCFYPWMVFVNHPSLQRLHVRVWNTRINQLTGRVTFIRNRDMPGMQGRIEAAVQVYLEHRLRESAPAWPSLEKCAMCDAASECPEAKGPVRDFAADPEAYLRQYVALTASAKQMAKVMAAHVDKHGDLRFGSGDDAVAFGRDKPTKSSRRPSATVYSVEDESEDE